MPWREGKKGVLVVDDEPSVLLTYGAILQKHGFAAKTAISSAVAIQLIDTHEFDLLLCDYSLERQHTGFEVIDHARKRKPGQKAILLTGYASAETADQAQRMGVPVMYKPIDLQELFSQINHLLEPTNGDDEESESEESDRTQTRPRTDRARKKAAPSRRAAS
jgi:two-component system, response regulator RegA